MKLKVEYVLTLTHDEVLDGRTTTLLSSNKIIRSP